MGQYSNTYKATAKFDYTYRFTCEHCGADSGDKKAKITAQSSMTDDGHITRDSKAYADNNAKMQLMFQVELERGNIAKQQYPPDIEGKCAQCGKHQHWEKTQAKRRVPLNALGGFILGLIIFVALIVVGDDEFIDNTVGYTWLLMPFFSLAGACCGCASLMKINKDAKSASGHALPVFSFPEYTEPIYRGCQPLEKTVYIRIDRDERFNKRSESFDIMLNGKRCGSIKDGQSVTLETDYACNSLLIRSATTVVIFYDLFFTVKPGGQSVIAVDDMGYTKIKCSGITYLSEEEMTAMIHKNEIGS